MVRSVQFSIAVALATTLPLTPTAARADVEPGDSFEFTSSIELYECRLPTDPAAGATNRRPPVGAKFDVVRQEGDVTMIRFWRWTGDDEGSRTNAATFNDVPAAAAATTGVSGTVRVERRWCVSSAELELASTPYERRWQFAVGALTFPLKLRPGVGDATFTVDSDISLSVAVGGARRLGTDAYLDIAVAFGTSIVDFTPTGSTEAQQRSAMTFAAGVGLRYRQAALAIFVGFDVMTGNNRSQWEYRRRPWFGLSLGVSLFSQSGSEATQ